MYDNIELVHIPMTDLRKDRPRPNRQHGKQPNLLTDNNYTVTDKQINKHTDVHTDGQTYVQTDGQTHRHTDGHTDRHTDGQTDDHQSVVIENRTAQDGDYKFGNLLGFFKSMDPN